MYWKLSGFKLHAVWAEIRSPLELLASLIGFLRSCLTHDVTETFCGSYAEQPLCSEGSDWSSSSLFQILDVSGGLGRAEYEAPLAAWSQGPTSDYWGCRGQLPWNSGATADSASTQSFSCALDSGGWNQDGRIISGGTMSWIIWLLWVLLIQRLREWINLQTACGWSPEEATALLQSQCAWLQWLFFCQGRVEELNCKSWCSSGSPDVVVFHVNGKRQIVLSLVLDDSKEKSNHYGSAWCLLAVMAM